MLGKAFLLSAFKVFKMGDAVHLWRKKKWLCFLRENGGVVPITMIFNYQGPKTGMAGSGRVGQGESVTAHLGHGGRLSINTDICAEY